MAKNQRRLPAWFVGLMIAAVVTLAVFLLLSVLGFGDDPVVESLAAILG
jgi:type VI protein secretion system component VasF